MKQRSTSRGFTILELMVSMGIFTILGSMVVVFMQQSLNIFSSGTRESAMYDQLESVLPFMRKDLEALYIGDQWDAPKPPPTEEQLLEGARKPPPPPIPDVRLRAGQVKLKRMPGGPLKDFLCPYFAFVAANANEWSDEYRRRAGERVSKDAKPFTPEIIESDKDHVILPLGGLMEIVWIAIPEDPDQPSILTLYRGERSPIGHPKDSLLDPNNLDTIEKIKKACRPVKRGVIHFGAVWRNAFAKDWNPTVGGRSDTDEYVGTTWDSTRGLDPKFAFHRKDSQGDPSDDIFPHFVKLEVVLINAGNFGFGQGELQLRNAVTEDDRTFKISNAAPLQAPGAGVSRYFKIGTEWIGYEILSVDAVSRTVNVRRGRRGTKAVGHESNAWIYLGTQNDTVVKLTFRDRYAIPEGAR